MNNRPITILALAALLGASAARAQEPQNTSTPTTTTDTTPSTRTPYWELIGGWEGDSHQTGFAFVGPQYTHPINDNVAWLASVSGNYLYYSFRNEFGGTTRVHSPGFTPAVGLKFGQHAAQFTVTAGLATKHRHEEIFDSPDATGDGAALSDTTEWRTGADLGGSLYWNASRTNVVQAILNYGTVDKYTWGTGLWKHQMTNHDWHGNTTFYLGLQGIGQGNQDIHSWQAGGLAEVLFVPSHFSLQFRSGYKHSSFPRSPGAEDETGPYFGVGLYKRF